MPRIFISYSHDDYDYVRQLAAHLSPLEELDGAGVEVWHDERFEAGDEVPPEIQRQLASADVVIAVLSRSYLKSGWCTWEWKQARANGRRIVPVLLRSCLYQPRCGGVQVIPQEKKRTVPLAMMADPDAGWVQVVTAAAKHLGIDLGFGPPEVTAPGISWPLMLGATVGPWTLGSLLGEGGYGAVFAAEDAEGRACALKVYRPRPERDEDARGRERFRHGAAVLRGLSAGGGHPGIVGFIDGPAESDGYLWYAMERVPGRNLDAAFTDLARLPLSDRLQFFESLVAAVRFAHLDAPGGPVYHRDLTPENVLVDMTTTPPRPVLIDFDLARDAESDSLTRTQALVGKINYVPPEQSEAWKGGPVYQWERPDSELRDLWALGMLLQFVACGKASLVPALRKAQRDHILSAESAELQAALDDALDGMLHVDPAQRPQGIAPIARTIATLRSLATAAPAHTTPPQLEPPRQRAPAAAPPIAAAPDASPLATVCALMGGPGADAVPALVELATRRQHPETLHLAGAALLALGAPEADLDTLRALAGGSSELGMPSPAWATIPAGEFMMGQELNSRWAKRENERPRHRVKLSRSCEMLATPVTQALYAVVTGDTPSRFKGDLRRPVERVSWDDAQRFCEKLSRLLGRQVRLPSEAEWEYGCRAGTETAFWSGSDEADLARTGWYEANSGRTTHPVAERDTPNAWGLHDMHGNVWEWTADWYADDYYAKYAKSRAVDPAGPTGGVWRVMRGGSWFFSAVSARAAYRNFRHPTGRYYVVGFRVVLPVPGVGGRP
jgi:formylglycine-generating enzyme required for sulfatase activity